MVVDCNVHECHGGRPHTTQFALSLRVDMALLHSLRVWILPFCWHRWHRHHHPRRLLPLHWHCCAHVAQEAPSRSLQAAHHSTILCTQWLCGSIVVQLLGHLQDLGQPRVPACGAPPIHCVLQLTQGRRQRRPLQGGTPLLPYRLAAASRRAGRGRRSRDNGAGEAPMQGNQPLLQPCNALQQALVHTRRRSVRRWRQRGGTQGSRDPLHTLHATRHIFQHTPCHLQVSINILGFGTHASLRHTSHAIHFAGPTLIMTHLVPSG